MRDDERVQALRTARSSGDKASFTRIFTEGGHWEWALGIMEDAIRLRGIVTVLQKAKKRPPSQNIAIIFPDWWPHETWKDFVTMRLRIRAPLTDGAVRRLVNKIEKLRAQGHDPDIVIGNSVEHAWRGVFAPTPERTPGTFTDQRPIAKVFSIGSKKG